MYSENINKIVKCSENGVQVIDMLLWRELPTAHCSIRAWRLREGAGNREKSGRLTENKTKMCNW